jgi:hypothetical protein
MDVIMLIQNHVLGSVERQFKSNSITHCTQI